MRNWCNIYLAISAGNILIYSFLCLLVIYKCTLVNAVNQKSVDGGLEDGSSYFHVSF